MFSERATRCPLGRLRSPPSPMSSDMLEAEELLAFVEAAVDEHRRLDSLSEKLWATERFQIACRDGDLWRAEMLAGYFNLHRPEVQSRNNVAFRWACANGHPDVARWLVETFGLRGADAAADDASALFWALEFGHADVVAWLDERFGLRPAPPQEWLIASCCS